ncbi:MAG TPA: TIGR03435 family protein [Bryobacteraceae bacterium]|jgi:uncharacterized protein (TIGR03435 family)|nr:TIGR03435 family protein [Bryobacteraceae bacterium]
MKSLSLTVLLVAVASGQTTAPPAFDAASIKLSTAPPGTASGIDTDTGRIAGHNVTLRRCIRGAYDIPESRIVGGPKWADEERYDIDAKAAGPAGGHELMAMLQQLLAERFKLVIHRETRALSGYALVTGKKGILVQPSKPGAPSSSSASRHNIDATGCDMNCLAMKLSEVLHAPVTNTTGIGGRFDFKLEWPPEELQTAVFGALEEQLGLKLEGRKVPTEVIVIDSAQKPSEN